MRTKAFFEFIRERHAIWQRRQAGLPKPWTQDPILQSYRFCNVYRELDTVTQWIRVNWREPNTNDPHVWFAMALARLVNWPPTLGKIDIGTERVNWNPKQFVSVIESLVADRQKAFTGAYMIPAGSSKISKAQYLADEVLTPMWEARGYAYQYTTSLAAFHKYMMSFNGMGSFLAGQVVCDTKYTRLLDTSLDWWHFACPGPGSQRGLNRVMSRPVNQPWEKSEWFITLQGLKAAIGPLVQIESKMPPIHAQDLQNCLCEFDKYERVRLEEGKPRSKYAGLPTL